jgi:hypothetical protein
VSIPAQIECTVRCGRRHFGGRKEPDVEPDVPRECVPRLARLMALALRFDSLVRAEEIETYAALARLGRVSRARISQITNLLHLAPDIQEEILFLKRGERGRDRPHLRQLQPIAAVWDWQEQRRLWQELLATCRNG